MRNIATEKNVLIAEEKQKEAEKKQKEASYQLEIFKKKEEELMIRLTEEYHSKLKDAIKRAAEDGKCEKYMNLRYEHFKANHDGFGNPAQVQSSWLKEMTNPESKYLKVTDGEDLECLEGLTWDIWGNSAFTTVFKW